MIIYATNILTFPLVIVVWAIDAYLLLISVRLIAGQLKSVCGNGLCQGLKSLTDPIPQTLHRKIVGSKGRNVSEWISWLIVILGAFLIRHLVLWVLMSCR